MCVCVCLRLRVAGCGGGSAQRGRAIFMAPGDKKEKKLQKKKKVDGAVRAFTWKSRCFQSVKQFSMNLENSEVANASLPLPSPSRLNTWSPDAKKNKKNLFSKRKTNVVYSSLPSSEAGKMERFPHLFCFACSTGKIPI